MTSLRHHLLRHSWLGLCLVVVALLMRIAVPAGYMPTFSGNSITVEICSGYGPMKMTMDILGRAGHNDKKSDQSKGEMPCAFSALAAPSLAGADPILLALAVAFIIATMLRMAPPVRVTLPSYLRPPPRGPPATA